MRLLFYKEKNKWFVDLPTWEGSKADLEMVDGADRMLDELSFNPGGNKATSILLDVLTKSKGEFNLTLSEKLEEGCGAYYKADKVNYRIWLCDVTRFVFGGFPETIGFTKINESDLTSKYESTRTDYLRYELEHLLDEKEAIDCSIRKIENELYKRRNPETRTS